MVKLLLFSFFLIQAVCSLHGQQCGFENTQLDTDILTANIVKAKLANPVRSSVVSWVPIQFIIVRDNDGFGGVQEERIFEALCLLNEEFEDQDIQFFMHEFFIYKNADFIFEQATNNSNLAINYFINNKVDNAINVFVGSTLSSGNSGYYSRTADAIYMDKFYVNSKDIILSHELGHFFGLRHTFYGWEDTIYDLATPTPTFVNNGESIAVEYVDRSKNCNTAADLFCDTPADYITLWEGNCNYSGGAIDPDGESIDPEEKNIMSYFSFNNCAEYLFSDEQKAVMLIDYEARADLITQSPIGIEAITAEALLVSPFEDEEVGSEKIEFIWDPVEHSDYYKLEVSRLSSFAVVSNTYFTDQNTIVVDDLVDNRTYYWRVTSYNQTNFCDQAPSASLSFKTSFSTSTNYTDFKGDIRIYPNPSSSNMLYIDAVENITLNKIEIFDQAGQIILTQDSITGNQINVCSLKKGLYILSLHTEKGTQSLKFIKTN